MTQSKERSRAFTRDFVTDGERKGHYGSKLEDGR